MKGKDEVVYRAKVKLHGTNAAIRRDSDGTITCQSRSRDITIERDNAGFAAHVHKCRDAVSAAVPNDCIVFGEWCGPGVQKGTAINLIADKIFAVFAVFTPERKLYDPSEIREFLGELPEWLYVLPWYGEPITINFTTTEASRSTLESYLTEVEKCDPWVKSIFGVEGIGEGLVLYPQDKSFSSYSFKIKGEEHKVKKTKQKIEIGAEDLTGIREFVDAFVTPARLEQCISELGIEKGDPKNIGMVLKWMSTDIIKEAKDEIADSGFEWKKLAKFVTTKARTMYVEEETV